MTRPALVVRYTGRTAPANFRAVTRSSIGRLGEAEGPDCRGAGGAELPFLGARRRGAGPDNEFGIAAGSHDSVCPFGNGIAAASLSVVQTDTRAMRRPIKAEKRDVSKRAEIRVFSARRRVRAGR